MKTKSILFFIFIMIILPVNLNAQLGALRRAINKQIDHKVDSTIEKNAKDNAKAKEQTDKTNDNNKQAAGGTKETGRGLFGGKIDIKYDDEYKFTGRIYMQLESYDKKDVAKSDYNMYFNANTANAGIEFIPVDPKDEKVVPTTFLFDAANRSFMILLQSSDSKTGIISSMPSDSAITAQAKDMKESNKASNKESNKESNPDKATITKTGNTRMIAGYKCDEYKIVDQEKEGYSNVWMTKDVKLRADKKYWGKAGIPTYYNYPGFEGAVMLAMEAFDKKDNPLMKMETKEINENFPHSISTTGYTFMKMNFGQAGKK